MQHIKDYLMKLIQKHLKMQLKSLSWDSILLEKMMWKWPVISF